MKNTSRISGGILLILSILIIYSCVKEKPTLPIITTTAATEVSYTTATSGGNVTNDGGASIVSRGVCWNTSVDPTITNNKTIEGSGLGAFTSNITQLTPNTLFYIRAYATNSTGTAYGNHVLITTSQVAVPVLTTTAITSISQTTAVSGGNITVDNGGSVTARGVCWSTSQDPTTSNSKTSDGTGTGSFISTLTALTGNTTYYARAYAINSIGTAYGNQVSFKTSPLLPTLSTVPISSIASKSCISGGNISSDGGATVTARGVCWSTTQIPTISNNKTEDGTGIGIFSSNLIGLTISTTYYVRSYATNSVGTSYGGELSFTTLNGDVVLTTSAAVGISETSAVTGGNITSDGGNAITARGTCLSTTPNPTMADNKTIDGSGSGLFISTFTGLTLGTKYYIRSYATNAQGTFYGSEQSFIIFSNTTSTPISDIDGNTYKTVKIGTQEWMAENLKVTKYQNGDPIPNITIHSTWITLNTGAYCNYNNDVSYVATYGSLYNFYAVDDNRKICPTGWHVPSNVEWSNLEVFLGGRSIAAGKMLVANGNSSGFTGLCGGYRVGDGNYGEYGTLGVYGHWWLATKSDPNSAMYRRMQAGWADVQYWDNTIKTFGASIRCLKD